ncbi:hypothetical protein FA13DRAFT_1742848 [Coprinellus micaceus]|uniref:G domain-containing protein n=1 Tax=Coprinellus micaceus TaxID=71717 RepID=A0A4Y7SFA5_COPMI|nr:hypothetical protein FA13DRAFT_1742848 [Coprinellus micaceus]
MGHNGKQQKRQGLLIKSGLDEVRPVRHHNSVSWRFPVMGQTKAGKSTLINSLVDDETKYRTVGHRMVSETSETSVVVVERAPSQYAALNRLLNDRRIVLVDTPGFNDTTMNDAVVLTSISQWLLASYGEGMRVGGILHLRDITQSGWNGVERRDFNVFSKICGDDGMNQVSLELKDGVARVDELLEEHWRWAIEQGASLAGAINDPWYIIQQIVTSMDALGVANRILHIQDELANKKYFLSESDAGKEVCLTLTNLLSQAKEHQRAAREDGKSPHAREHLERRREEIEKLAQQLDALGPSFVQRAKRWWSRDLLSLFQAPLDGQVAR